MTTSSGTAAGDGAADTRAGWPPSDQDTSAGRINVATWPGGLVAAVIAAAASTPTSAVLAQRRTQPDTEPATASMSDSNGASKRLW